MSATTSSIDNYRKFISGDSHAVRMLAVLLRSGPQTETQLAGYLGLPVVQLKSKIAELFRAHFVSTLPENRWKLTELAEEVLAGLRITDVVAQSLLVDQDIGDQEKSFLKACMQIQAETNPSWSKYHTGLLQSIQHNLHYLGLVSTADSAALLYDAVVGLDSDLQQLGSSEYCKRVFSWHEERNSELWSRYHETWLTTSNHYQRQCEAAMADVVTGNALFFCKEHSEALSPRLVLFTWSRLIGVILSRVAEAGLVTAFRTNEGFPSEVWSVLKSQQPEAELNAVDFLSAMGTIDFKDIEMDSHGILCSALGEILGREVARSSYPVFLIESLIRQELTDGTIIAAGEGKQEDETVVQRLANEWRLTEGALNEAARSLQVSIHVMESNFREAIRLLQEQGTMGGREALEGELQRADEALGALRTELASFGDREKRRAVKKTAGRKVRK